ncbi:hypothetical protein FHT69_006544 [Rhizobium sp. BK008]|nr:hypothetical protein [Rhizobium sp. BK008]
MCKSEPPPVLVRQGRFLHQRSEPFGKAGPRHSHRARKIGDAPFAIRVVVNGLEGTADTGSANAPSHPVSPAFLLCAQVRMTRMINTSMSREIITKPSAGLAVRLFNVDHGRQCGGAGMHGLSFHHHKISQSLRRMPQKSPQSSRLQQEPSNRVPRRRLFWQRRHVNTVPLTFSKRRGYTTFPCTIHLFKDHLISPVDADLSAGVPSRTAQCARIVLGNTHFSSPLATIGS